MILRLHYLPGFLLKLLLTVFLLATPLHCLCSAALDNGSSQLVTDASGSLIKIFLYRPNCDNPSILIVFHGLNRKAKRSRDNAKSIADNACLMVFAPLFDRDNFPNWRYHRAGVVRHKRVQPFSLWTASVLKALIDFSRKHVENPNAKIYLFGHSAGGQFLSRSFAYTSFPQVERVVIANPSVYVEPSLDVDAPYGFAGIFDNDKALSRLKAYLSSPISIYLGTNDVEKKYLVDTATANRQGRNRYERGRHIFLYAMLEAARQHTPFSWKLVEACGIGHSSARMIEATEMMVALGLVESESNRQHLCHNELSRSNSIPVLRAP